MIEINEIKDMNILKIKRISKLTFSNGYHVISNRGIKSESVRGRLNSSHSNNK